MLGFSLCDYFYFSSIFDLANKRCAFETRELNETEWVRPLLAWSYKRAKWFILGLFSLSFESPCLMDWVLSLGWISVAWNLLLHTFLNKIANHSGHFWRICVDKWNHCRDKLCTVLGGGRSFFNSIDFRDKFWSQNEQLDIYLNSAIQFIGEKSRLSFNDKYFNIF